MDLSEIQLLEDASVPLRLPYSALGEPLHTCFSTCS